MNLYKICLDIFPGTLLLNRNRFHEKRSHLDTSFKQKSRVSVARIFLKIAEKKNLTLAKKSSNLYFMSEK